MAIKRFCDICDMLFTEEDTQPLIRVLKYFPVGKANDTAEIAKASVMITNERDHVLPDICVPCRIKIITEGEKVAMLQPTYTSTAPDMPPDVVRTPPLVASAPVNLFEPSIRVKEPAPDPENPIGASALHDEST